MKKIILSFLSISILFFVTKAQESKDLFMPKELKKAYNNGTRSFDGVPGKGYFQNKTDYIIKAEFSPETRTIEGYETITYKNNSQDSLTTIYIKLYQDLFKKGGARNWDLGPVDIHDGVNIKSMKINNINIDISSNKVRRRATIMSVKFT